MHRFACAIFRLAAGYQILLGGREDGQSEMDGSAIPFFVWQGMSAPRTVSAKVNSEVGIVPVV
jgi:hypothetical protein